MSMPNGKGSPEWGWIPSIEELVVTLIVFLIALGLSRNLLLALPIGVTAGLVMLWMNNGSPWFRR